ncbi:MAG: WXG100 family type VII secretion target [Anaerolineae bacterium]|nr:WXG100 family type VII secretion target [Anaerolineae bacterium]
MSQIIVAPERLEGVAHLFDTKRAEAESLIQSLQGAIETLDVEWDGVAQNKFYAQWNEMVPRMSQFALLLGEISSELQRIAQVFRETDERVI